jgi:hypothetical protein
LESFLQHSFDPGKIAQIWQLEWDGFLKQHFSEPGLIKQWSQEGEYLCCKQHSLLPGSNLQKSHDGWDEFFLQHNSEPGEYLQGSQLGWLLS